MLDTFSRYLIEERHLSPKTEHCYLVDTQQFKRFLDKNVSPKTFLDITREDVQFFADYLTKQGYKPCSVNRKLASLGTFYQFLVKKGFLESSPIHHQSTLGRGLNIRKPKVPKKELLHISTNDIKRLLDSIEPDNKLKQLRDKTIYGLMALAGLKAPELQSMTWGDVDLTGKTINIIRRQQTVTVSMSCELFSMVEAYCFARMSGEYLTDDDVLFINKHGKSLSCRSMHRNLDRYAREIGLRVNPSQLRHSFAVSEVHKGANLAELQERLGHLAETTTKVYYTISQDAANLGEAAPIEEIEPATTCINDIAHETGK